MKKWMHRGMSLLLAMLMLCSLIPFSIFADEEETTPKEIGLTVDTETGLCTAVERVDIR